MIEIIPAILTDNVTDLSDKLARLDEAVDVNGANIRRVQIDIIDGIFADNRTIDPANMVGVDTNLSLDFHLMVKEPIKWIEKCGNAAADRIIGQIEMMESQSEFVGKVAEMGLYVGLAIDLDTPVSKLDPTVLNSIDVILVMAVKAGWGGQKFEEKVLTKISELDEIRLSDKTPFKICVDGGETEDVIGETHFAGADQIVIGKRILAGDIPTNVRMLEEASHHGRS